MTVPSMNAAIGWHPQVDFDTEFTGNPFYWHKAVSNSFQPIELVQPFPPELGGTLLAGGLYKGGYYAGGDINMVPRLDNNLGWLLWSFAGSASITGSGPYTHIFPGMRDKVVPDKWLTFRRIIPEAGGTFFGEAYANCRVQDIILTAQPGSILNMRASVLGITSTPTSSAAGAGWDPDTDGGYELYTGAPIACKGHVELPDGEPLSDINSATIRLSNGGPNPQQMMVLGQYTPADIPVLSRTITVELTAFWRNATIWKNIHYGGGSTWTPELYQGYSPFDISFETPGNLNGKGYGGSLGFWAAANAITWQARPIDTRGGDIVVMQLVGTVSDVAAGEQWKLLLNNGRSTRYSEA